jgi:uncharacterized ParB-like nuclease family protein
MKIFTLVAVLMGSLLMTHLVMAQDANWPKTATTADGTIVKLYQWQPESFKDNTLKAHAPVSILENGKTEPVFGVAWFDAKTTSQGNQVQIQSIYINNLKLPGVTDDDKLDAIANAIEDKIPSWNIALASSDVQTSLELDKQQAQLATQINNTPPKVIYSNVPAILVTIDGAPKTQHNDQWGVDAVVNTPFVIVKNNDDKYYLYGGKHWYSATAATGNYKMVTNVPSNLEKIEASIRDSEKNTNNDGKETDENTMYNIIVSTEPAELIQSRGEANFASVEGTGLLYVSNSDNDIFMDINSQQYYVLLSGRWYRSKTLSGQWQYVASDQLPADFAKIPKGSPKDNVLASVAGTDQANDAVQDAQIPQTAKVERDKVHADVTYDGDPQFESIDGTDMDYAINSPASVIRWRGRYYSVDDGIWFESPSPVGPWTVCVTRPYVVALIPPRYPVYYMKYVYIYDVTPDYVYMGYTPGYLNAYVCGPTVVYGTGYYYRPWFHRYYYPRPYTWGFGVRYNPWFGWGFGVSFGYDWFNVSIGIGGGPYWGYGGWWGPRVYRPAYYGPSYYYRGGYYGRNSYAVYRQSTNVTVINNYYGRNNIYRGRGGIVTRDYPRGGYSRPDRGGRYATGGSPDGGRMGGFDRNGYGGRNYNPGGRTATNDGFRNNNGQQPRMGAPDGGRRYNSPDRIVNQPLNNGNGGRIYNPGGRQMSGSQPSQGGGPVRTFDRPVSPTRSYGPGNGGGEVRTPQRGSYATPSQLGGRIYQPQSRPSQPQGGGGGYSQAPRVNSGGGGGYSRPSFGGGGGYSRPSSGGNSGGGGRPSGGEHGGRGRGGR